MPPKKKVAGDAGKGEKIFKNLCAVCHSFGVSFDLFDAHNRPTELVQILAESLVQPPQPRKDSLTRMFIAFCFMHC